MPSRKHRTTPPAVRWTLTAGGLALAGVGVLAPPWGLLLTLAGAWLAARHLDS